LESKRQIFPRFYFLSNDELLQILANSQDIKSVEKHINKCFDNICGLTLAEGIGNMPDITGMISGEREEVKFNKNIAIRNGTGVELWMGSIQESMITIVQRKVKEAHQDYYDAKVQRKDWVLSHIGQAVATVA
jgi:dynein heavy chain, axonemal